MSTKKSALFYFFFVLPIMISACGKASSSDLSTDLIPTEFPTQIPTNQPEPTATEMRKESGYFTLNNDDWVPVYEDELTPFFLPEDMSGGDIENFQLIQYGYFGNYDPIQMVLTMRSNIMMGNMFRDLQFQLDENQKVTCLPETIGDTPLTDVSFMISDGHVSFPSGPGEKTFNDLLPDFTDSSYFVIVLTDPVQTNHLNAVKLIANICP